MDTHEPVDIVDEHNKILYSTTKHQAHTHGLLHRTVIGTVRDTHNPDRFGDAFHVLAQTVYPELTTKPESETT